MRVEIVHNKNRKDIIKNVRLKINGLIKAITFKITIPGSYDTANIKRVCDSLRMLTEAL